MCVLYIYIIKNENIYIIKNENICDMCRLVGCAFMKGAKRSKLERTTCGNFPRIWVGNHQSMQREDLFPRTFPEGSLGDCIPTTVCLCLPPNTLPYTSAPRTQLRKPEDILYCTHITVCTIPDVPGISHKVPSIEMGLACDIAGGASQVEKG